MIRRLSTLLLLAVAGTALLAGCGGKSSTGTTTVTTSPGAATAPGVATGPGAATSPGAATGDTGLTAQKQQYVAICQHAVEGMKALPAAQRAQLKSSCEKVGIGKASKGQLAREVCLAQASRLPSPAARARAQKLCSVK
jgi:hypothetical protein